MCENHGKTVTVNSKGESSSINVKTAERNLKGDKDLRDNSKCEAENYVAVQNTEKSIPEDEDFFAVMINGMF